MNERTHFFIKNKPLTLYSQKGWCWLCVRGEFETATDCYILTESSSDHISTSSSFWLDCSTVGHWGPKALRLLLALNSVSCPQLTPNATGTRTDSNWLKPCVAPGYIFVWHRPASCGRMHRPDAHVSLFYRLFTQVHLLIDGSVEGQYVTNRNTWNHFTVCKQMGSG